MLVFIDESGHPRPGDPTTRPVLLAVCIREADVGRLSRAMFALRRNVLNGLRLSKAEQEGKAVEFLNRRALTQMPAKREFADSLFDLLRDFPLAVFAIVMERPDQAPYEGPQFLQRQHVWLLERIDRYMERDHPEDFAIPIFDAQEPTQNRHLSDCFTGFMARTDSGRGMKHVVPTPFFVDSALTPGIQIADFFAYVVRINEEQQLHQGGTAGDLYLSAIRRYYNVVRSKTSNYELDDGYTAYGITTMDATKFLYGVPDEWLTSRDGADEPETDRLQGN